MRERPIILCVEDERDLLTDMTEELTEAGYCVRAAEDGAEALRLIEEVTPDLVLCDITMPIIDGFTLLDQINANPHRFSHMPFIFLTALGAREDVVRAKRLGADDYLVKPVDYDLLLATVEARLRQVALIRQTSAEAALPGEAVLNLLSRPFLLIGRDGSILFRNRAASGIVGAGAAHHYSAPRLRHLLESRPDASVFNVMSDTGVYMVICRLDSGPAEAAVFIGDGGNCGVLTEDKMHRLCDAFGFTATESRIALLLCLGLSPSEISQKLAIASTTTAFHLKNLYQKTGTGRQAALVAKLLSHPAVLL